MFSKQSIYFLSIFILFSCSLLAQKKNLDSLNQILSQNKLDTVRVKTLNEMAYQLKRSNPHKAFIYAQEAHQLSQKLSFSRGEGEAFNNLGNIYDNLGLYDSSLYFHQKSLAVYEKINNKKGIASCYNNIGEIYREKGEAGRAIDFYLKSLEIKKSLGDRKSLASTYNNLGAAYTDMSDYGKALEFHLISLRIKEELGDKQKIGSSCQNVGLVYHQLGNDSAAFRYNQKAIALFLEVGDSISLCQAYSNEGTIARGQHKPEQTFASFRKALAIAERLGIKKVKMTTYNNLVNFFSEQKSYDSAMVYSLLSLQVAADMRDSSSLALIEHNLGQIYFHTGKYAEAFQEEKKAEFLSRKKNQKRVLRDVCLALSELYEKKGDLKSSLQYLREYSDWSEIIFNESTAKQLSEQQVRYETEKKQREISDLRQKEKISDLQISEQNLTAQKRNVLIIGLSIGVLLLLVSMILFFSRRRAIIRAKEEKAALVAEEQERIRIAKDIHDDLGGGLTRIAILSRNANLQSKEAGVAETLGTVTRISHELTDSMRDLVWALHPENATLDHLVARIREFIGDFYEDLNVKVNRDFPDKVLEQPISKELLRNVYLTVKEVVNNSTKHSAASEVFMEVKIESGELKIVFRDYGKGFDTSESGHGNGLRNMKNRIESIHGRFGITSVVGEGTRIEIAIPV